MRQGVDLESKQLDERLATCAIVDQVELVGELLRFKVIFGHAGPATGWVSLKASGKELLVLKSPKAAENGAGPAGAPPLVDAAAGQAETAFPVEVHADLKKSVEKRAEDMKKKDMFPLCCFMHKFLGGPLPVPKLLVICFHMAVLGAVFTSHKTDLWKWMKGTKKIEMWAIGYCSHRAHSVIAHVQQPADKK